MFKARLDGAVSNLVQLELSLPMADRLELNLLSGPFQSKAFHDSVKVSIKFLCDDTCKFISPCLLVSGTENRFSGVTPLKLSYQLKAKMGGHLQA